VSARAPEPGSGPAAGRPVTGLSHVAIATPEADRLADALVASLDATRGSEELLDGGALRVVFVHLGPVTFELLEPRDPSHTVAKFLEKRGPGLHHVSLAVAGIETALARCAGAGIELIDRAPRPGAHGSRVAFLHPKSLGGVLIELSEGSPAAPEKRE
jgi:methylmalonyl-CoA/ethylmalonyl-CoA epimerase